MRFGGSGLEVEGILVEEKRYRERGRRRGCEGEMSYDVDRLLTEFQKSRKYNVTMVNKYLGMYISKIAMVDT